MFLKKWFRRTKGDFEYNLVQSLPELTRLRLLENGVRNYSGGISKLHERINFILFSKISDDEKILSLLEDLSIYFSELKIVVRIEDD
ncbi:hypothetical protein [Escherichia coli]